MNNSASAITDPDNWASLFQAHFRGILKRHQYDQAQASSIDPGSKILPSFSFPISFAEEEEPQTMVKAWTYIHDGLDWLSLPARLPDCSPTGRESETFFLLFLLPLKTTFILPKMFH